MRTRPSLVLLLLPALAWADGMGAMGAAAAGLAMVFAVDLIGCVLTLGLTLFALRKRGGKPSRVVAWIFTTALLGWGGFIGSFGMDLVVFWIGPVVVGLACAVGLFWVPRARDRTT